jgi:hypothetical protein
LAFQRRRKKVRGWFTWTQPAVFFMSMSSTRRTFLVTGVLAGLAGSFALGRATGPGTRAIESEAGEPEIAQKKPGARTRASIPKLAVAAPAAAPECGEAVDRRPTAASLVETLFLRLPSRVGGWDDGPEASANLIRPYLKGLVEGVRQSSPAVQAAFVQEFTERLCRGGLGDDQLVAMAYLGMELPGLTELRAYECVFSQRKQEDVVTWYMLDAWRQSGQDKSPAIAELQRTATDPRTRRRFLTRDEELQVRAGDLLTRTP